MKIPGFDDPEINKLQLVSDWLSDEDSGSWLMVLDNAYDKKIWIRVAIQESPDQDRQQQGNQQQPAPLSYYLPLGPHCFVLITTRDSHVGEAFANAKEKPIDVLPLGLCKRGRNFATQQTYQQR
jgi:hypothetical protein